MVHTRLRHKHLSTSLAAALLAPSLWVWLPTPSAKAASITLFDQWIDLSSVPEFSVSGVYLAKFGMFTNGFVPNMQNLGSWDSNFVGGTGTYDSGTNSPYVTFDNTNNINIPIGETLWLVVYNVAPSAQLSTATAGVVVTWDNLWVAGDAEDFGVNRRGQTVLIEYDFAYWAGGSGRWASGINYDEDNRLGPTRAVGVVSPTHTFSYNGDLVIGAAVPEPTSAILSALGASLLLRRRRKSTPFSPFKTGSQV